MHPAGNTAHSRIPATGELTLDHLAYFVPHIEAASDALERLGFTLSPFSVQSHRLEPGGPLVPAGAGNRCVMLERGYLEFLTPTADTDVANQLRTAIKRYTGLHSIVFGTAAPAADHARLERAGFAPLPPLDLQREVATDRKTRTARFTVVRTPPGTMAEGRIQFCRHLTPQLLWQERWLHHPNRAVSLRGVVLCVADPAEAAERYARFTGLTARSLGKAWRMDTARGTMLFVDPATLHSRLDVKAPALPWIAGCVLETADITATSHHLRSHGIAVDTAPTGCLLARPSPHVGGVMLFAAPGSDPW